jgi:ABC-type uncharacterized transport system permease subunit
MILASELSAVTLLTFLTAALYLWSALRRSAMSQRGARLLMVAAWLGHAGVLAFGFGLAGDAAHFGFGPAMSMTTWLVLGIYGVETWLYPQLPARWGLSAAGATLLLVAWALPGHALPERGSVLLAVHLAMGVASYGLFGVALLHAWATRRTESQIRMAAQAPAGLPLLTLERLTYRLVTAGFVLLSATLLGGYFFGHLWSDLPLRWDHKILLSVLAWAVFAVLVIGRRVLGWRGARAIQMLYVGSGFLLLAYAGSRFVLEVILERSA